MKAAMIFLQKASGTFVFQKQGIAMLKILSAHFNKSFPDPITHSFTHIIISHTEHDHSGRVQGLPIIVMMK